MKWETPTTYFLIHMVAGFIAYFYPVLWIPIVFYNLGQLALGGRFFIHTMSIEPGNSFHYTLYKLAQYVTGWGLAFALNHFRASSPSSTSSVAHLAS